MEMSRRQQIYNSELKQNTFPTMPHMNTMARPTTYPSVPIYSQDMMDYSAMQRYQHERYLQQAREMQTADVQTEEVERVKRGLVENEMTRDVTRGKVNTEIGGKERITRRKSYRAVMRNGELVEDENGYLVVTHNYVVLSNVQAPVDMSNTSSIDSPLNLSVKDQKTSMTTHHHSDTDSGYNSSPRPGQDTNTPVNEVTKVTTPDVQGLTTVQARGVTILLPLAPVAKITKLYPKIAPKPTEDEVKEGAKDLSVEPPLTNSSPTLPPDMKTLFPHLKTTNTGSLVLWNFLWALLQDSNHDQAITWISFPSLKFRIVNPSLLATMWGQVKQNPSMDWLKIKKILDLYLRKNLISSGSSQLEFTFLIVPKAIKETLGTGRG
eukprot:GFUD01125217.1.p1 GENE.GFUD01125217.1~~GFUD01125217.1.p1  ORF type:complete len:441 (-),score=134.21 GFUD01125217.1:58-1194(-)